MAKPRREITVNIFVKFIVFGFNVIFWFAGIILFGIGIWAWDEKGVFRNLGNLSTLALDPALIFICVGAITFIIATFGCFGALRENTCHLGAYVALMSFFLFAELGVAILAFVFQSKLEETVGDQLEQMIVQYREDDDVQDLVDWIQQDWLQCCGVDRYEDWNKNMYFNCTDPPKSVESCGVPFSCCKAENTELVNYECGFGVTSKTYDKDASRVIYVTGCLESMKDWLNDNIIPVGCIAIGIVVLQSIAICLARNLRSDVLDVKSRWH